METERDARRRPGCASARHAAGDRDDARRGQQDRVRPVHLRWRPQVVHLPRLRLLRLGQLRAARRRSARHARWTPSSSSSTASPGKGNWITIYTNGPTHAYMEIAGLWFDTAAQTAANGNDRWSTTRIGSPGTASSLGRVTRRLVAAPVAYTLVVGAGVGFARDCIGRPPVRSTARRRPERSARALITRAADPWATIEPVSALAEIYTIPQEHLDFRDTIRQIAQRADRAAGGRDRRAGGVPA